MAPKAKKEETGAYKLELRFGRCKSKLNMGIVGLPNVGKSSLFNLLTAQHAEAQNFPFCTIDPNKGRVQVPDERYDQLVKMWAPKSQVPPWLDVTDIAGLVRGAHDGAGLGNAFLSHIQAVDGIYHMVRLFDDPEVTHVDDEVDPVRDLETITFELCQKDLAYFQPCVDAYTVMMNKNKKKIPEAFTKTMDRVKTLLEENKILSKQEWTPEEVQYINDTLPSLISTKPVVYLLNMSEDGYKKKKGKWLAKVMAWIQEHGGGTIIPLSVEWEQRLFDAREDPEQLKALLAEEGNTESKIPKIVKTGFTELNLVYFFTCGEDEVKAWPLYKGASAPQAAGAIHGDMEKCFIKAEVVKYDDFVAHQDGHKVSMAGAKAAGKYQVQGKQYIVEDGDILHIMHNAKK